LVKLLKFAPTVLAHLAKVLAYGWIFAIIDILKRALEAWRKLCKFISMPHPAREETGKDCTIVNNPSYHRPDPCIYSQDYLLKLGLAVTWDNPDIVIKKGGVVVTEHDLLPDTDYEINATVWNNSYDAPAVGVKVLFSFLTFGVTTLETAVGQTFVNLGVKGGVNHPALAKMPWRTPPVAGHYCLKVVLSWIDDANPANNVGQNNINVVAPQSPAVFQFRLRNATGKPAAYRFEVDAYELPAPPACGPRIEPGKRPTFSERMRQIRAVHGRGLFPVPAGWTVELNPDAPTLQPDQEIDVTAKITPPAGFTGKKSFNVNARTGDVFAGGVTLTVATA
jgi:hypothetical protein